MPASPLTDFSRLCVHTITTKPWSIEEATDRYAAAGVKGVTVWRQWLDGRNIARVGDALRAAGIEIVSLCRGGFFPAVDAAGRRAAIDDNLKAIDEAAALGAPLIVLVCGAVPRSAAGGLPPTDRRRHRGRARPRGAGGRQAGRRAAAPDVRRLPLGHQHPPPGQRPVRADQLAAPGRGGRRVSPLVGSRAAEPRSPAAAAPAGCWPSTSATGARRPKTC